MDQQRRILYKRKNPKRNHLKILPLRVIRYLLLTIIIILKNKIPNKICWRFSLSAYQINYLGNFTQVTLSNENVQVFRCRGKPPPSSLYHIKKYYNYLQGYFKIILSIYKMEYLCVCVEDYRGYGIHLYYKFPQAHS